MCGAPGWEEPAETVWARIPRPVQPVSRPVPHPVQTPVILASPPVQQQPWHVLVSEAGWERGGRETSLAVVCHLLGLCLS